MPVTPTTRKLPDSVKKLVDHLRSTGTGKSKLAHIETIAFASKDGDEFMASVRGALPAVTVKKIDDYLATPEAKVEIKTPKEVAGNVVSKDENQSSLPELTFTDERKAPVLREPGTTKVRQAGADRVAAASEGSEGEGDKTEGDKSEDAGEEATSSVADDTAEEAKDKITRMTSVKKLEGIVLNDKRVTVQEAAQKRLDTLNQK